MKRFAVLLALSGCTLTLDYDDLTRCTNGVIDGEETDVDCGGTECSGCKTRRYCEVDNDCALYTCPTATHKCACPQYMVEIVYGEDLAYCIDQYEVSVVEYNEFLLENPVPTIGQELEECAYKTTHEPAQPVMMHGEDTPMAFIDWCDAYAYCDWDDKRLCGALDGDRGRPSDVADANGSAWFRACTGTSSTTFPFGDTPNTTSCNGQGFIYEGMDPPGTICSGLAKECATPAMVFDLSGNVAEWEDACDDELGEDDLCLVRGGSFEDAPEDLACGTVLDVERNTREATIGFRCCGG